MTALFKRTTRFLVTAGVGLFLFSSAPAEASPLAYDLCNGVINGTWFFKEGRPMTLTVQRTGPGNQVRVLVQQRAGAEWTYGTCNQNARRARLNFRGQYNFGRVNIDNNGYTTGSVSNYGFEGYLN